MLNRTEYLLIQLASEAAEIAHRATKALHFGLDEVQTGQPETNAERLTGEIIDFIATLNALQDATARHLLPPAGELNARTDLKRAKLKKYMAYAQQCGTLER